MIFFSRFASRFHFYFNSPIKPKPNIPHNPGDHPAASYLLDVAELVVHSIHCIHPACFAPGSILKKPAAFDGRIELREFLQMSVLIDHDVIDGAPAARFVGRLNELMQSGFGL